MRPLAAPTSPPPVAAITRADLRVMTRPGRRVPHRATPEAVLGVIVPDPGHEAASWRVVQRSAKPVILVPHLFVARSAPAVSRVLVPLDGTQ